MQDGLYKMEYVRNPMERPSVLRVAKDRFFQKHNIGDTVTGKINWLSHCYFTLNYDLAPRSAVANADKGLAGELSRSFGNTCFELLENKNDTILVRVTYQGNLHINVNEGRLIKLQQPHPLN